MNTKGHQLIINGLTVEVVRKDIKNLHIGVYPPDGHIRVAAPLLVDDEAVRLAITGKLRWLRQQQEHFHAQERQSKPEMLNRESHYFLGQRYLLNVIEHSKFSKVILQSKSTIDLYIKSNSTSETREKVLSEWYRSQLKELVPALLEKWCARLNIPALTWSIRKMKTKWGTCHIEERHIWLNLELAKKPLHCIEYVIVHEILHLLERHHNDRFTSHLDNLLPHWRSHRDELNQAPLGQEKWG